LKERRPKKALAALMERDEVGGSPASLSVSADKVSFGPFLFKEKDRFPRIG
jgi:hypothetical protein